VVLGVVDALPGVVDALPGVVDVLLGVVDVPHAFREARFAVVERLPGVKGI